MTARVETAAFLQAVAPAARRRILAAARSMRARRAEILVQKGDTLSDVFLVTAGVLRIYALSEDGREAALHRLRAGEVCLLSLNAAFTHGRYPANVRVESGDAEILRIPGEVLRTQFTHEPAIQALVLRSLTATIDDLLARLDEALLSSVRVRLERLLAAKAGPDGRVVATHQALADSLGVSRETVSREIARLKRAGRLTTGRGALHLA